MAEIKVPIQVNLSDDWAEQVIDRLCNDPDAEWAEIIRCRDCKWFGEIGCAVQIVDESDRPSENDFCSFAERRTDERMDMMDIQRLKSERADTQKWLKIMFTSVRIADGRLGLNGRQSRRCTARIANLI